MDTVRRGSPGISTVDLRALRNADRIRFSFTNGEYAITAVRDREETADGFEQTVVVPCDGQVTDYDATFGCTDNGYRYCHESILTPSHDEVWQTVVGFIKPGDVLELDWIASSNGWTKDLGLHVDTLKVVVRRENGDKVKYHTFIIRTQVCPDNTARMIRQYAW